MKNNSHFSEEDIAMCADSINDGTYHQLPESFRNHLSECEQCASEVLIVADIAFDFDEKNQKNKTSPLKKWVLITSISTAAAVLIFVIFKLMPSESNMPLEKNMITQSDTFKTKIKDRDSLVKDNKMVSNNPLLSSMEPNEKLEKLYKNHKETYRVNSIKIISKGELEYPKVDSLKWANNANDKLIVEIFNNKDKKIKTIETNNSAVKIPKLSTGIYYWKLINEDFDLLYVGKIKVK